MQFNKNIIENGVACPCCSLRYKLIEKFYNKETKTFAPKFYADNKKAQGLYQYKKEKYNLTKEPLYFYAEPVELKNGSIYLKCEKCEGEFVVSKRGEVAMLSSGKSERGE